MTKKRKITGIDKLTEVLIFMLLVVFPFGQLLKLEFSMLNYSVSLQLLDVLALSTIPIWFFFYRRGTKAFHYIIAFLSASLLSLFFSLTIFNLSQIMVGFMYWVRLLAYTAVFLLAREYVTKYSKRELLFKSLIAVCFFTAVFGWIQYFFYPDLTSLKILGWDDHLYRLTGTFLDPGFTSIILVFGAISTLAYFFEKRRRSYLYLSFFFALSVALTYARASYLALLFGVAVLFVLEKKYKRLIVAALLFLAILPFLPRPGGEGVRLERTASIEARIRNYKETFAIVEESPLLGVGYNNICAARLRMFGGDAASNACYGADSSLLFVLAATGIVGLFAYLGMAFNLLGMVNRKSYFGKAFISIAGALLVHSFFVNSLFYAWVMSFMGMLLAISLKDRS